MIRCLIIKTSSLGDIIHTLPAITDAVNALGDIEFDWVVEETFAEIPAWHPAVKTIIPVAIRRWRKQPIKTLFSEEWKQFKQRISACQYDYIIDAQGLLKSAWLTRYTHGPVYGLDKNSAREPLASRFYQYPLSVHGKQHAVERVRQLFAAVLGYTLDNPNQPEKTNYGLPHITQQAQQKHQPPSILFLHGTTWPTKHWLETYWQQLAGLLSHEGYTILLPWGNEAEYQRAERIKAQAGSHSQTAINVLDKMSLTELMTQLRRVTAVVAVDTGLAHLAAALDKPVVAVYGPTSAGLTGTYGKHQCHLQATLDCAPCFKKHCDKVREHISPECFFDITPQNVIQSLHSLLDQVQSA